MDSQKKTSLKTFALVLVTFMIDIYIAQVIFGFTPPAASNGAFLPRFVYQFFHANIFHLALNAWCFLQLVFSIRCGWKFFIPAYIISIFIPADMPTIGFSAINYAMIGMLIPVVPRKALLLGFSAIFLIGSIFIPSVSASSHIFAFVFGLLYSLIAIYRF